MDSDADVVELESQGLANFIRSIWDLAYDLEDIMETYFPKLSPLRRNDRKGRLGWLLKAKTVRDFAVKIEEIKRRAVDIKRRRETYQVPDASGPTGSEVWDPRTTFPHTEEVNVVGIDEQIEEWAAKVSNEDSEDRVISITGLAGIGKTTLARKIYKSIRQSFNCSAWICLSRQPNVRGLLHDIARQVGLKEEERNHNLEGNLFHLLSQKRYVLVLDDIWQIEHWNALKNGIPVKFMNGSRIIITSRSNYICVQIGGGKFLHELQPLDEEKNRELFFKEVMAAPQDIDEDGDPSQLENIGEKILKKCSGVPAAIVVIAGMLRTKERSIHAWKGVLESIGKDEDQHLKIFDLSYKDLPSVLKPCFLYFGLFPEDLVISAFQLINLWAAEGFIHGNGVRAVEDVGQDYLNHLVGRNLIQVVARRFNEKVSFCRIHDILHDLCIMKVREMNFFNTINDVATSADSLAPRRVTTLFQWDAGNYTFPNFQTSKLRSLLCFDYSKSDIMGQVKLCLRSSKFLRVLITGDYSMDMNVFGHVPQPTPINEIMKLKHLCHHELVGWDTIELPYPISNLKNLLTLDLSKCRNLIFPDVIWEMKHLRHILLPFNCRCRSSWAPSVRGFNLDSHRFRSFKVSLPNLLTFRGLPAKLFEANWLHKLDSLRRLKVYSTTEHIIKVLSTANSLSQRLEELYLFSECAYWIPELPVEFRSTLDLSKYVSLGKLHVRQHRMVDFPRHDKLPTCLTELILEDTRLEMNPMVTLKKLPRLKILILGYMSYNGNEMVFSGEADSFPQLEVLKIDAFNFEDFEVEEGAMPKLKELTFRWEECVVEEGAMPNLTVVRSTFGKDILIVKVPGRIRNIMSFRDFKASQ